MGRTLREATGILLRYSGIPRLIRNTYARTKVAIVLYHDPRPADLRKHLEYLSRRYTFITLDHLVDAIRVKDWSKIPPKSLVITMDDGHRGNLDLLPIFREYRIEPTIYLVSGVVGTDRHYWFRHVGAEAYSLMRCSNEKRLKALRERFGFTPTAEYPENERHALSRDEIAAMEGFADFQAHTRFHPILTTCSDDECRREIRDSKSDLETFLRRECRHFSYPNGDYGEREIAYVKEAGFLSARTTDVGWNDVNTNPYMLRITGATDDASVNILAAQLSGVTMYLRYLRQGSLTGKHRTIPSAGEKRRGM